MVREQYDGNVSALQQAYWRDINYGYVTIETLPPPPFQQWQDEVPASAAGEEGGSGGSGLLATWKSLAVAIAAAGFVMMLTAVILTVIIWREGLMTRMNTGHVVLAPGFSVDTSLCITDIQVRSCCTGCVLIVHS